MSISFFQTKFASNKNIMVKNNKKNISKSIQVLITNKCVDYLNATKFMENRVKNIIENNELDLIWLLYHPNIYTAGITSKKEDFINGSIFIVDGGQAI